MRVMRVMNMSRMRETMGSWPDYRYQLMVMNISEGRSL